MRCALLLCIRGCCRHNLCLLRSSPSPRPPPPAVQSLLPAGSRHQMDIRNFYHVRDHRRDAPCHGYHFLLPGRTTTSAFSPPAPSLTKAAVGARPGGRSLNATSSASPHPSLIHLFVYYLDPFYSSRSTAFRWTDCNAADCNRSLKKTPKGKTLSGSPDKALWSRREGMRGSPSSGTRVISGAKGRPPGVRTSEGIQIEFYFSFWYASAVLLLGEDWVCFSEEGS